MNEVYKYLDDLGVKYEIYNHPPIFTVEDGLKYDLHKIPGAHTKNLFLKNKNKTKYYLVSIEGSKRADIKKIQEFVSENKLSFASPEDLMKYLGLTPGSVSPFGLINDKGKQVTYILDEDLYNAEILNFHPNINSVTLSIGRDDFLTFLKSVTNGYKVFMV